MLGDGQDARHVGELHVGLPLEQLLEEHEEGAPVVLGEQPVEEHRVPLVHDEAEAGVRPVVGGVERGEQVALALRDARLGEGLAQVGYDAVRYRGQVVIVAAAALGQRAEVDVDHVVRPQVRHGRLVARDLQPLEQGRGLKPPREEAGEHAGVDGLAEAARACYA